WSSDVCSSDLTTSGRLTRSSCSNPLSSKPSALQSSTPTSAAFFSRMNAATCECREFTARCRSPQGAQFPMGGVTKRSFIFSPESIVNSLNLKYLIPKGLSSLNGLCGRLASVQNSASVEVSDSAHDLLTS